MRRRDFITTVPVAGAAILAAPHIARAQATTLRLHQFLPPQATIPSGILVPWADQVAEASDGDLTIQHFDAMALGGAPPDLFDQARDGIADITMTVVGYTPGRFPRTEVFDLPFLMRDPVATSRAYWDMMENELQDAEFGDVKILASWVHGPGVIHSNQPVTTPDDMAGLTVRGPTRVIADMLAQLGAEPVGMPVPAIPEAISRGVINGTVIPWEVTATLRLSELLSNHTEFASNEALYTTPFVLAMNRAAYEGLPDDLRTALDSVSGSDASAFAAQVMLDGDGPARQIAVDAGNDIITIDEAASAPWREAALPVIDDWIASRAEQDVDGQATLDRARALIEQYSA
ncbi:MAG: TRAP transporter substrate-binding protein [Pseudomonadota bacterium]